MNRSVKILLLAAFVICAFAGVLIFEKTRVSPPSNLEKVNQYALALASRRDSMKSLSDFRQIRDTYLSSADMASRFYMENMVDAETADIFHRDYVGFYANSLLRYANGIFHRSEWPEESIRLVEDYIAGLSGVKLISGDYAVGPDFNSGAASVNGIISRYRDAQKLARNTWFTSIADATSRISKSREYASDDILKNNTSLVASLRLFPGKVADSHFAYLSGLVNGLSRYDNVTKDYYMETLIPKVDKALNDYKTTKIYGNSKKSITDVENHAVELVTKAMAYYE